MAYREHIVKTWDRGILSSVLLELGFRCNLDCIICYNDRAEPGVALTRDHYLTVAGGPGGPAGPDPHPPGGRAPAPPGLLGHRAAGAGLGLRLRIKSNGPALNAAQP